MAEGPPPGSAVRPIRGCPSWTENSCMQAGKTAAGPTTTTDEEALIRAHLPLVHYGVADVAARIPRHVNGDDLLSAGMLGLLQAARTFDPSRGVPFERFARARIRF